MSSRSPLTEGLTHAPLLGAGAAEHASSRDADFRVFFRTHCAYVGRIAMSILGHGDDVEDLVQDVFLLAHRHRDQPRLPGAIRGWLATITVREARRKLRRRKLRAVLGFDADVAEWTTLPAPGVDLDQRVIARRLERELDRLPVPQRIAWTLRCEGHALEEVARMSECSLATVKRRIDRAQVRLTQVLGDA